MRPLCNLRADVRRIEAVHVGSSGTACVQDLGEPIPILQEQAAVRSCGRMDVIPVEARVAKEVPNPGMLSEVTAKAQHHLDARIDAGHRSPSRSEAPDDIALRGDEHAGGVAIVVVP